MQAPQLLSAAMAAAHLLSASVLSPPPAFLTFLPSDALPRASLTSPAIAAGGKKAVSVLRGSSQVEGVVTLVQKDDGSDLPSSFIRVVVVIESAVQSSVLFGVSVSSKLGMFVSDLNSN